MDLVAIQEKRNSKANYHGLNCERPSERRFTLVKNLGKR